jgi:hypothetical protein
MTKSRGINAPHHRWTAGEIAILRARYPDTKTEQIAKDLGLTLSQVYRKASKLGLAKSDAFMQSDLSGRVLRGKQDPRMIAHRFQKGCKPWNTGLKGVHTGGVETQFKPGQAPINHKPVGSTRICSKGGYVLIKVAEGKFQWRLLHREVWKERHGEYPPKGHVLTFKDGNKLNCSIENLELVTQAEMARRNSFHRYTPEMQALIRTANKLKKTINNENSKRST